MTNIEDLQRAKENLLNQLDKINKELSRKSTSDNGVTISDHHDPAAIVLLEKSGYLYKWQDRTIGWTGTKWDLRFVRLERGRLSYYRNHSDVSPRYVLTLRNCAVRDDGFKPNTKYWKRNSEIEVDIQTPGAYYHVFSIYQRSQDHEHDDEHDDVDDVVPLLRFSTQSYAEKSLWIDRLSEACAFCDSDEFIQYEKETAAAEAKQHAELTKLVPTAHGTLPAMYFAQPPPKLRRQPSNTSFAKKRNTSYVKLNKSKDASKTNSQDKGGYAPSRPMHRSASPSYLSDEAPMQNYRGLLNLGIIILVISNCRILLGTMREYGFVLADWFKMAESTNTYWQAATMEEFPLLTGLGIMCFFVNAAFIIESLTSKKKWPESFGILLHIININAALIVPTLIVWYRMKSVVSGIILTMCASILWMKLISYVHANTDYRNHPERCVVKSSDFIQNVDHVEKSVVYPQNITLTDIYYFWFAPTLTYQIAYPRLVRRNWLRIFTLVARLFLTNVLILFLVAQVVSPNLKSLTQDLESGKHVFSVEIFVGYLLKLAIACTYIWLLVFYAYFHLFFNILAELLKFGDRVFYKDWWNSSNVSSYWRLWNLPVHYWLVRHLYFPCIRMGINKNVAMVLVFLFSAVMHEYVISLPFHMIRPWAFFGMIGQIPLVTITKFLDKLKPGSSIGNMIFWLTFCIIGQPMAILMYTIDHYYRKETNTTGGCVGFSCSEL